MPAVSTRHIEPLLPRRRVADARALAPRSPRPRRIASVPQRVACARPPSAATGSIATQRQLLLDPHPNGRAQCDRRRRDRRPGRTCPLGRVSCDRLDRDDRRPSTRSSRARPLSMRPPRIADARARSRGGRRNLRAGRCPRRDAGSITHAARSLRRDLRACRSPLAATGARSRAAGEFETPAPETERAASLEAVAALTVSGSPRPPLPPGYIDFPGIGLITRPVGGATGQGWSGPRSLAQTQRGVLA